MLGDKVSEMDFLAMKAINAELESSEGMVVLYLPNKESGVRDVTLYVPKQEAAVLNKALDKLPALVRNDLGISGADGCRDYDPWNGVLRPNMILWRYRDTYYICIYT